VALLAAVHKELSSRKATLKLKGLPSGAQVLVDGKSVAVEANGDVQVEAGVHTVRVTMDKRVPFERPAIHAGPGEIKEVEVVLMAPIDPSTLPRNHTWTWVAGGTAAAGVVATGVVGFLLWRETDQYNARFDSLGRPRDATRADYPVNGQPCRIGIQLAGSKTYECEGAVTEGNTRLATIRGYQIGTAVAGGATLLAAIGTAIAYVSAPVADTEPARTAGRRQWSIQPLSGAGLQGAQIAVHF
jgi:hypothetical protein